MYVQCTISSRIVQQGSAPKRICRAGGEHEKTPRKHNMPLVFVDTWFSVLYNIIILSQERGLAVESQWKYYLRKLVENLEATNYIGPNDIPNIDLYMDQVTKFLDEHLEQSKRYDDDKLLTKTMINNYTKSNLLPSPVKKKYSKDHMYLLVFIYYLKSFLSINDVQHIVGPMKDMFFGEDASVGLEEIYRKIFEMETTVSKDLSKDVMKKFDRSKRIFTDVEGEKEQEFLSIFSFISMLSFDVYLKKQMIEQIIDDLLDPTQPAKAGREEKKAEKKEKKEKK